MTFISGKLCDLRILEESDEEARVWTNAVMGGLDHLRHLFTGSIPSRWIDVKAKWKKERESGDVLFGIWAKSEWTAVPLTSEKGENWYQISPTEAVDSTGMKFIGTCGLHSHRELYRSWEARWLIFDPECIGKGIGTEAVKLLTDYAFRNLNAHRIWLGVSADNVGAIKCYEGVGYKREGVLRDEIWCRGKYVHALRYSVLEDEWKSIAR